MTSCNRQLTNRERHLFLCHLLEIFFIVILPIEYKYRICRSCCSATIVLLT
jgi:hypothetical protein